MTTNNTVSIGQLLASMRETVTHTCPACGREFTGIYIATYCSDRCRNAAAYVRRKAARRARRTGANENDLEQ